MPRKWTLEKVQQEAAPYSRRIDFQKAKPDAYAAAVRHGWLELIGIPRTKCVWTRESIITESSKCDSRKEFRERSPKAYAAASERGMLQELTPRRGKWSDKAKVIEAAKRQPSLSLFHKNERGAYDKATRERWLRELYPHDMRTSAAKQASQ